MNMNNRDIEEKIFKRIPKEILIISFVLSVGAFILFDLLSAVLLLFGGVTAVLSFIWLKSSITRLLDQEKKKAVKSAALLYGIRLVLIIAVIFIIILFFQNKVLAFAAGFSTIIIVLLIEGAAAALKIMKWKS
jgi:hypothetical protein